MRLIEIEYRGPPAVGGVETHVLETSRILSKSVSNVEIWSSNVLEYQGKTDPTKYKKIDRVEVRKFWSIKKNPKGMFIQNIVFPGIVPRLLLLEGRDTVVHSHSFPSLHCLVSLYLSNKFRRVLITPHFDADDLVRWCKRDVGLEAFSALRNFVNSRRNVTLTAITNREKRAYQMLGVQEREIEVVPNGVALEEFDRVDSDMISNVRKKYVEKDRFLILFAGRVSKVKGIDILIRAIKRLRHLRVSAVVVGPDGGASSHLKELVTNMGLENKVCFTGELNRDEYCAILRACDVLVLPSYGGEAFGIVLAEGMACRKPVIGSRTGGIVEIIREGENGYLFDVGSSIQLAERIQKLYEDEELRTNMGSRGREIVVKNYTWDKVAQAYLHLVGDKRR